MILNSESEWPPPELKPILEQVEEWDAWLVGQRKMLENAAGRYVGNGTGLIGWFNRVFKRFWGSASTDLTPQAAIKIHVPIGADIARASADLLFADPPTLRAERPTPPKDSPNQSDSTEGVEDNQLGDEMVENQDTLTPIDDPEYLAAVALADATQDRIDLYLRRENLLAFFAECAELASGLGGVYIRVTWDFDNTRVFAARVDVDQAFPEFKWDKLSRVTFWRTLKKANSSTVWRHLEIHEEVDVNRALDEDSPRLAEAKQVEGIIRHQLYEGTNEKLGRLVPLTDHPDTAQFANLIDYDGDAIRTHSPGLAVVYIPNITPNTLWRKNPVGRHMGVADIMGCEDLLDRLDHAYSALIREMDLSRARIIVPDAWLQTLGPGQGQIFDKEREIFTAVEAPANADSSKIVQLFQPAIRVDEYLKITQELTEIILRRCGYSPATFGEDEVGAPTATEINSKNARSRLTRNRKLRHWVPALEAVLRKMLAVDLALGELYKNLRGPEGFADGVDPMLASVIFPSVTITGTELAQMVTLWDAAGAVSLETKIKTLHSDWDDDAVKAEMRRIREDQKAAAPPQLAAIDMLGRPALGESEEDNGSVDPNGERALAVAATPVSNQSAELDN